ncbi:Uncharacterised protein [Candidatus Tiddalikarchaeum anstoanum]|nr:Uncharacterised protein [Candidatus Tiddalikarchaeum anstoanum]
MYNDILIAWFNIKHDYLELIPSIPKNSDGIVVLDYDVGALDFRMDLKVLGKKYYLGHDVQAGELIKYSVNPNAVKANDYQDYLDNVVAKWYDCFELGAKYLIEWDSQVEGIANEKTMVTNLVSVLRSILDSSKDHKINVVRLDLFPLTKNIRYCKDYKYYTISIGGKKTV